MAKTKNEKVKVEEVQESPAREEFQKLIEIYEKQNPNKFAVKKDRLLAKLATL